MAVKKHWAMLAGVLSFPPLAAHAQRPSLVGRWVDVAPTWSMSTLVFDSDGTVHKLSAGQWGFNAKYVRHDSVITLRGAVRGIIDKELVVQPAGSLMARRDSSPATAGHWLPVQAPSGRDVQTWWIPQIPGWFIGMEGFLSFHGDSSVDLESGAAMHSQWSGDTLFLTGKSLKNVVFLVRLAGDTLMVTDTAGRRHRFVQRPWGCFVVGATGSDPSQCFGWIAAQPVVAPRPPFERDIEEMTRGAGLAPITGGLPAGQVEVRLWSGFGIMGVNLRRAVWDGRRWRTTQSPNVYNVPHPEFRPWVSGDCWGKVWTTVVADSFFALRAAPRREPTDVLIDDGWAVVVEVADGARYFAAGAINPDSSLGADDRRLLRFIGPLLSPKGLACPSR